MQSARAHIWKKMCLFFPTSGKPAFFSNHSGDVGLGIYLTGAHCLQWSRVYSRIVKKKKYIYIYIHIASFGVIYHHPGILLFMGTALFIHMRNIHLGERKTIIFEKLKFVHTCSTCNGYNLYLWDGLLFTIQGSANVAGYSVLCYIKNHIVHFEIYMSNKHDLNFCIISPVYMHQPLQRLWRWNLFVCLLPTYTHWHRYLYMHKK